MKDNAYFDNAATSWPKPESVYAFMDSFFRSHGVNPGRSGSLLAVEAEQMITATRSMLGEFFGYSGPSGRVVFALNGTDALNHAIGGLIVPGDHVVTTRLEHNAVLRTLNHMERDQNISVSKINPDKHGYVDPEAIKNAINSRTKAIVLNHASNVLGTVQPLEEVADIARKASVHLIVDAAQTAGVIPIEMDQLGISVLTFPGHKGLFGPMGIGAMVIAESVDINPQRFGGTGVDSLSTYQPDIYPYRLEAGTVSLPGIAGLHAAQLWFKELGETLNCHNDEAPGQPSHKLLCDRAVRHIHRTELDQLQRIEDKLKQFPKARILGNARADARVSTLSFVVDGLSTTQIADQLDADHQVCIRAGLQCAPLAHVDADTVDQGGTIRVSPGYFTDEEDMQQLLNALDDILSD